MRQLHALCFSLLLAGCLDAGTPVPIATGTAQLKAPTTFLNDWDSLKVGIGGDAETSVYVSPDGRTILACSHGGFTQPSPLWASEDGGATFRRIDPQPNPIVSGDCDLAMTENGDWFIVYDTIASATVAASSDKGKTWRFHYVAAPPFGGVDRPWLQGVANQVYLIYADVMSAEPFNAMFTKSTDGGRSWSTPQLMGIFPSQDQLNCFLGHHIVKDAGQTIVAPINCWPGRGAAPFPNTINFLVSRDGGRSWATQKVRGPDPSSHRIASAAYAGPDHLYLAYTVNASPQDVYVMLSRDDGKSWSAPLLVAKRSAMPLGWPWLDGRADGSASLAWMNVSRPDNASGTQGYWQVHAARVAAQPQLSLVFEGPIGAPARGNTIYEFLMLRHDAQGRAYVVYAMPGDGCKLTPATSPNSNRNAQCVHLLREGAGMTGVAAS